MFQLARVVKVMEQFLLDQMVVKSNITGFFGDKVVQYAFGRFQNIIDVRRLV